MGINGNKKYSLEERERERERKKVFRTQNASVSVYLYFSFHQEEVGKERKDEHSRNGIELVNRVL